MFSSIKFWRAVAVGLACMGGLTQCGGGGGGAAEGAAGPLELIPAECQACELTFIWAPEYADTSYKVVLLCTQTTAGLGWGTLSGSVTQTGTDHKTYELNMGGTWGAASDSATTLLISTLSAEGSEAELTGGPLTIAIESTQHDAQGRPVTRSGTFTNGQIMLRLGDRPSRLPLNGVRVDMKLTAEE